MELRSVQGVLLCETTPLGPTVADTDIFGVVLRHFGLKAG